MPITIGSNIASLRAQRQLAKAGTELGTVYERLSSGMRINRASDDAAGLSIADSLRADARIAIRGVQNVNDGISLLNIADSAVESLSNIVTRLTELAEQSINGTYSNTQRAALDKEAQALSAEYSRIAKTTTFNGINLFDGSNPIINLQAGAGANSVLSVGPGGKIGTGNFGTAVSLGSVAGLLDPAVGDVNNDGNMDIVSASGVGIALFLGNGSGGFNNPTAITGITAGSVYRLADMNNDGNLDVITQGSSDIQILLGNGNGTFGQSFSIAIPDAATDINIGDLNGDGNLDIATSSGFRTHTLLGTGSGTVTYAMSTFHIASDKASLADFNNDGKLDLVIGSGPAGLWTALGDGRGGFSSFTGVEVVNTFTNVSTADLNNDGNADIFAANAGTGKIDISFGRGDGTFSSITSLTTPGAVMNLTSGDLNGDGLLDLVAGSYASSSIAVYLGRGSGTFASAVSYALVGTGNITLKDFNNDGVLDIHSSYVGSYVFLGASKAGVNPLLPFEIGTQAGSKEALSTFKNKQQQLSLQRGEIGAHLSRANVAVNVLQATAENFKAAESGIRDADIAEEAAKLVTLQIRQKAAAAILAQANQEPLLTLNLLKSST